MPTLSEIRRTASLARKSFAGGRPRAEVERCRCGANTANRAKAHLFRCCLAAGVISAEERKLMITPADAPEPHTH